MTAAADDMPTQKESANRIWPLSYFLTYRTYGTWLQGDARGWVSRRRASIEAPTEPPAPGLNAFHAEHLQAQPLVLDEQARACDDAAVRADCEHRSWTLLALNVRSNHVHSVVSAALRPERILDAFKSWSTRRLVEAGMLEADRPAWTRHGSTRYLWTPDAVERACQYVIEAQDGELWRLRHESD
jgi:REP element-mobilizing transposase RayT